MKKRKILSKINSIIFYTIVVIVLIKLYGVYKEHYFNGFIKAESNIRTSKIVRDKEVVTETGYSSYKIESPTFNDAIFYKKVKVKPNTPYKIKCKVKTENVEAEESKAGSGATISIVGTMDTSKSVTGTTDWQELELIFNSKNKETIEIGFRLGESKGIAWFSDFILEEGVEDNSSNWNMACFVFKNVSVEVNKNGKQEILNLSMRNSDIYNIEDNMRRFKTSCEELSSNRMTIDYDIYEIDSPITSISYSEQFGYYIEPIDVENIIGEYLEKEEYDHIFVAVRLGDVERKVEIPVYDWIGLGGMDLYGVGFSNIRLPNDRDNYRYTYVPGINLFPEEVFVHEFLHSLERNSEEYGYERPELHDNLKHGYEEDKLNNLKKWYKDYMNKTILDKESNTYIGLDPAVYTLKPPHKSEVMYTREIPFNKEPNNIIDELKNVFEAFTNMFKKP